MYPKHLYKTPGPFRQKGVSYQVAGAADAEEESALLALGWFLSIDEASGKVQAIVDAAEALEDALDHVSPATREELEQKAKELGVPFNRKTRDSILAQRIAGALD